MAPNLIRVAAASQPYPGEVVNGDAWVAHWSDEGCRISVIDGLGHGPEAATAAAAAVRSLDSYPAASPVVALEYCHRALAGTRGAAISIAQIDLEARKLSFAGVGNVEGRLWEASRENRFISFRGIVGVRLPTLRTFDFTLVDRWVLVLHTDGVRSRFTLPHDVHASDDLAHALLAEWARGSDDATVVVARLPDPIDNL